MKAGDIFILRGLPFMALPYKLDKKNPNLSKCVFCDFECHFLPRRCKGGRYALDENNLRVNCKAKDKMKCASPRHKNLVIRRVSYPLVNDELKAYCDEVRRYNKEILKETANEQDN